MPSVKMHELPTFENVINLARKTVFDSVKIGMLLAADIPRSENTKLHADHPWRPPF